MAWRASGLITAFGVNVSYPNFDYAFGGNTQHPVHAEFDGHDFQSNGISFEDYSRMSTRQHKLAPGRHGAAPDWVFNDSKLRAVLVGCIEARAHQQYVAKHQYGTHAERLARAQKKLDTRRSELEARIDKLCKAYMAAKATGDAAAAQAVAQKVERPTHNCA